MEEKKKSNVGLIIFLILIILGLAGYICYDKFIAKDGKTKCIINNTDSGNRDSKEKKDTDTYTYEDISGVYSFKQKIDEYDGVDVIFHGDLYLLDNGAFKYVNATSEGAETGNIGNYIIKDDSIILTSWFGTTSGSGLSISKNPNKVFDIKISDSSTLKITNCYNGIDSCDFKKSSNSSDNFNNINILLYNQCYDEEATHCEFYKSLD